MRKNLRAVICRWTAPLWPVTLVGILIGAAIGGFALNSSAATEATTMIRIHEPIDPDQIMTGTAPTADSEQSYVSGEVAYLTSPGFAAAVAKQLNEFDPPRISAIQDSMSSTVSLSAVQPAFNEAERILDAALKVYTDHVNQQSRDRGQAAIDAINGVLTRLQQDQSAESTDGPPVAPEQARIDQLLLQRQAIEVQTQRSAAVQVVQAPTKTAAGGMPTWPLGVMGGGLIGGILALAAALAWRKRTGVVTSSSSLEDDVDRVLLPTVRLGAMTESSGDYAGLARSLYAQLPAPRRGRILVVGASADSGTAEIAGLFAYAFAEHEQVSVVDLPGDAQTDRFQSLAAIAKHTTVVIDGGSVDTSPELPHAAEDASQIIVVAMVGHDVKDDVHVASQLASYDDVPVSIVCTRRGSRRGKSGGNHQSFGRATSLIPENRLVHQGWQLYPHLRRWRAASPARHTSSTGMLLRHDRCSQPSR